MNVYEKLMNVQTQLKAPKENRKCTIIHCKTCNKIMAVRIDYVKKHSGECMSCQKKGNKQALKHGDAKERLYKIWVGLSYRRYKSYEPMKCEDWNEYLNFKKWALENGYKENLTIDRIDNSGDYTPNNCQWITLAENSGKDKKIYTLEEEFEIISLRHKLGITQREMAKELKVSRNTIQRVEKHAKAVL